MKNSQNKTRLTYIILINLILIGCAKVEKEDDFKYDVNELNRELNSIEKFVQFEEVKGFSQENIIWSQDNLDLNGDDINDVIKVIVEDELFFKPNQEDERGSFRARICINNLQTGYTFNWVKNSHFYKEGTTFKVTDIDKSDNLKEFIVTQKEPEEEDPSTITTVFRYFGNNLLTKSTINSQGYNAGNMTILNNEFTIQHSINPKILGKYSLSKFLIKCTDLEEEPYDTSIMAACPFVYILENNKFIYKGEIIRNLIGKQSELSQKLTLGTLKKGKITIRISEEKNEISYINTINLEINKKLYSIKTKDIINNLIDKSDNKYLILKKGEYIDFEYVLDSDSNVNIVCKGYYDPLDNI
jgi:hypothetical protein